MAASYALLLGLEGLFAEGQPAFARWAVRILLAAAAGVVPVAAAQVESHFADEEFFDVLQAPGLGRVLAPASPVTQSLAAQAATA